MKRILLLSVVVSMVMLGYAQKGSVIPKHQRDVVKTRTIDAPIYDLGALENGVNPTVTNPSSTKDEAQVGTTWYDLQSNSAVGNRLYLHDDGTLSAVWTLGLEATAFPDRGTGYNYFDGTSWGAEPTERIESDRCGWPSIAAWGEDGEVTVSHLSGATTLGDGLLFNKRATKGTGDWEEFQFFGPLPDNEFVLWPRMVTNGENNEHIHLLCVTAPVLNGGIIYQGQDPALLYSRSSDGGETWDPQNVILDGTGIDNYFGISADEYVWAEPRGETIAFVVVNAWIDMFVMKSDDNGDTWEKIMIWEHPYPFFDWDVTITTDTIWCPDNSADIAIDMDGKVHLVAGISRVTHEEVGTTYQYYPYTEGIFYWNEDMGTITHPTNPHRALDPYTNLEEDYNLIGWMQDVDGDDDITLLEEIMSYRSLSLTTMPTISIGSDNQIFTAWAATTETYDNGTYNFKHIWTRRSPDGGVTWGNFYDLNEGLIHIFDECILPVFTGNVNESVHLLYSIDNTPGIALDDDHDYQENKITYFTSLITDLYTGIEEPGVVLSDINVSQNFPNPFNGTSVVKVDLDQQADLSLEVTNIMGQLVFEINKGEVNAGSHMFNINASDLNSGVYFYTVKADDSSVTRKMIVE